MMYVGVFFVGYLLATCYSAWERQRFVESRGGQQRVAWLSAARPCRRARPAQRDLAAVARPLERGAGEGRESRTWLRRGPRAARRRRPAGRGSSRPGTAIRPPRTTYSAGSCCEKHARSPEPRPDRGRRSRRRPKPSAEKPRPDPARPPARRRQEILKRSGLYRSIECRTRTDRDVPWRRDATDGDLAMPPSSPQEPLRLSADDLYSPRVDAFLDEQAVLNRALPEAEPQPWILRVLYSSYFYLSLASGLGAFVAWLIIEPFFDDDRGGQESFSGRPSCCSPRSPASSGCSWARPRGSCAATPQRAPDLRGRRPGRSVSPAGSSRVFLAGFIFMHHAAIAVAFWKNPQPSSDADGPGAS